MKPRCGGAVCAGLIGIFISFASALTPAIGQAQQLDDDEVGGHAFRLRKNIKYLTNISIALAWLLATCRRFQTNATMIYQFRTSFSLNSKRAASHFMRSASAITSPLRTSDPETGKPLTVVSQGYLL